MVRNNIPNMSEFVEDCFKAYLSFAIENEEERGEELRKAWETFHKAKLDIHLLMKIDYKDKNIQNAIIKLNQTLTSRLLKNRKTLSLRISNILLK